MRKETTHLPGGRFSLLSGSNSSLKTAMVTVLLCAVALLSSLTALAQWTAVSNSGGPDQNGGVMLLLPDGRVMCKTFAGDSKDTDGYGNYWNILTPGSDGNYANGSWSRTAAMFRTRLYFSSQVLADGRVYVAGGEYGDGGSQIEVYSPGSNSWGSFLNAGVFISDANSEMLPDGRVIDAPVGARPTTFIWDPATDTKSAGPSNNGNTNESAWVKLPDNTILFIQTLGTQSERYHPNINDWVNDAIVPVPLYETAGAETGPGFMLNDGRAFFLGGNSNTAYYTPSGTSSNGSWAAGPNIPNTLAAPDAAAAMMRNGKILCAFSPTLYTTCCDSKGNNYNVFPNGTSFWIFDPSSGGSFAHIKAPDGSDSIMTIPGYKTNMLCLPNGQILYGQQGSSQYYVYSMGAQINSHRPVITGVTQGPAGVFTLTGTEITGWSEGACYGDDWQMNTNYPIVKLTNGSNVYYARTYNWNSTGVRQGSTTQTTNFVLPGGLPNANYQLVVIANGIESASVPFCTPNVYASARVTSNYNGRDVSCHNSCDGAATVDVVGGSGLTYSWSPSGGTGQSISGRCPGDYTVTVTSSTGCSSQSTVTIHNTPELFANPTATSHYAGGYNISCNGAHDGSATAGASGGTGSYSYSWNTTPIQHGVNATGLGAGTYTVTVTDANGCTATGNVTLTEPPLLTATAAPTTNYNGYNVRCHGGSDGAAEAFPAGGVPPYTYSWSPSGQTTKAAINLSAQMYTVTVTDANGCTATANTTLTEPPQLTIYAGDNKTVYYGYPDSACAKLTATNIGGGVPPYTLLWSTGSTANSITVCPMTTTSYTVTIKDKNNCTFTDTVLICVIDVRCGNNLDKVTLCHNTGSNTNPTNTLCVALPAAVNHIAHGDQLAACGTIKTCPPTGRIVFSGPMQEGYLMAVPNPFADLTTVTFRVAMDEHVNLGLYDISGRLLSTVFNESAKGKNEYKINLDGSSLPGGMYYLILKAESGEAYTLKLTISR
jgi:hypothetical protein